MPATRLSSPEHGIPFRLTLTPDSEGLELLLGPLEAEIMRIVWADGPSKVKPVHAQICRQRPVAYTTVMTTMSRLAEKGVLTREKPRYGYGYVYAAALTEDEFVDRAVHQVLESLMRDFPSHVARYLETCSVSARR